MLKALRSRRNITTKAFEMRLRLTKMRFVLILTVFVLCFSSCKSDKEVDCYEKELRAISFGFETSLNEWAALGGSGEMANETDIQITSDVAHAGSQSVKFAVSPESYVNSGVRAELTFDPRIREGDEIFWEYSVFIPVDYQDVSLFDSTGTSNWQLMGQWHDQPDECNGQTWNTLPAQSPPIGIYYSFLSQSDPSYAELLSDAIQNNIFGVDSTWDEVSFLSLVYNNETIAIQKINKGEWNHLRFHTKWSTNNDGFIQGWINDTPFSNGLVNGKNMWNKASHYFKFGLYRNPTIPFTNEIYYDEVKIY